MLPRATRPFHFWFSSHVKCVKCCSSVLASLLTLFRWRISKNQLPSLAATTKGGVGKALQALKDFYPQLQFECWKSPEPGIYKKKLFPLPGPALSLRDMPAGKQGRRWSSSKERINLSTRARRKYGRQCVPTSSCPPVLLPSTTKLNISGDWFMLVMMVKPSFCSNAPLTKPNAGWV